MLLTILTPTYNRMDLIKDLFESLKSQTSKNFEWLVVDDGSTDCTWELLSTFAADADFRIRRIRKENGGKHTALNTGIAEIKTELTFIVDSDDELTPDAVEQIEFYYEKYRNNKEIGCFSFLRRSKSQGILLQMPEDEYIGFYIVERIRKERPGDMAEVFYTHALQEFPFPVFEGERFLSEDVVWIPLGRKYKTLYLNRAIYLFDYLDGGLTRSDKRNKLLSPLGSMMRGKQLMNSECGLKVNIKGAIIYGCYDIERKKQKKRLPLCLKMSGFDLLLIKMVLPIAYWYHRKWVREARRSQ